MITPTDSASQRTRNRIREHNLKKKPLWFTTTFPSLDGQCSLFFCTDKGCGWTGWLPDKEVICS